MTVKDQAFLYSIRTCTMYSLYMHIEHITPSLSRRRLEKFSVVPAAVASANVSTK